MSNLLPWLNRERTRIFDLETTRKEAVPEKPGVYILLSLSEEFKYPRRISRVFYIGKSDNLQDRLWKTHRKNYLDVRDHRDPDQPFYYSIYEYAATYGCKACWIQSRRGSSVAKLEANLLRDFAKYHGRWPFANNQGHW